MGACEGAHPVAHIKFSPRRGYVCLPRFEEQMRWRDLRDSRLEAQLVGAVPAKAAPNGREGSRPPPEPVAGDLGEATRPQRLARGRMGWGHRTTAAPEAPRHTAGVAFSSAQVTRCALERISQIGHSKTRPPAVLMGAPGAVGGGRAPSRQHRRGESRLFASSSSTFVAIPCLWDGF